ncbi:hypothetical protein JTB14_015901 [Gonioctena quinquepunctata]|nr:hypothetical protein JTB14_015901 [Gonioctena quinquepunctata]
MVGVPPSCCRCATLQTCCPCPPQQAPNATYTVSNATYRVPNATYNVSNGTYRDDSTVGTPGRHTRNGDFGSPMAGSTPIRRGDVSHRGQDVTYTVPNATYVVPHESYEEQQNVVPNDIAYRIDNETIDEIEALEDLGILQRSHMDEDVPMGDAPMDELNLSNSRVLEAVPHESPRRPRGQQGRDDSLGLMDARRMNREMVGAGNVFDFSGPDDLGPYPVDVMNELARRDDRGAGTPPRFRPGSPGERADESLGILRDSQMEDVMARSAENAVDELSMNRTRRQPPPRRPCPGRAEPSRDHSSLGLLNQSRITRSMLGAGNEFDFSGPDDQGPYPVRL